MMRHARALLSIALAIFWLGMPVHCNLEAISTISLFACADTDCSSPADEGCADDFCNNLESGKYFPKKSFTLAKAPLVPVFTTLDSAELSDQPEHSVVITANDVIPPLSSSWLFVQRVAAPPRAPSILS